jgi:uncharacterized coiled-coil protein SlyX
VTGQGRIEELETEVANANAFVQQLTAKMASSSQQLTQQHQPGNPEFSGTIS